MRKNETTWDTSSAGDRRSIGKSFSFEQKLLYKLLQAAGDPPITVNLWDGTSITTSDAPQFALTVDDRRALWGLVSNPDLKLGELYTQGRVHIDGDLVAFLETINQALPDFNQRWQSHRLLSKLYLLRRNTLDRARHNIYHHYDIGNDFYRLWLDEQMLYTCAYFPDPDLDLEQAQLAKMDHICRKLQLKSGDTVAEAGCGWGALALHMARYYGVRVRAFNISREQLAYARQRAVELNLDDKIEFVEGDYRTIDGQYDVFVSVGMLEHVGVKQYPDLGEVMNRVLKPDGRGLVHSIGRNRPAPMNAWIEKHIFPGAYPPSISEAMMLFEPWRFSILDIENLRLHYAETLRHWLLRFEAAAGRIETRFDAAFVRAWRFYLSGSIAAFTCGELQLFQILFSRFDNNQIPFNRKFIYSEP